MLVLMFREYGEWLRQWGSNEAVEIVALGFTGEGERL